MLIANVVLLSQGFSLRLCDLVYVGVVGADFGLFDVWCLGYGLRFRG